MLKDYNKKIPLIDFSKFKGKQVAIVEGEVVADGRTSKEAFEKAKQLFPKKLPKDILLLSVPNSVSFVYLVNYD